MQHWKKNGKNLRKYRHGSWRKSETKMKRSLKQGIRVMLYTLRRSWTFVIKSSEVEPQFQKYKGRVVLRGDIVRSIYWTKIISFTSDGCKSDWRKIKATRMRRTSSRCSICLHPGQNGRCTIFIKDPKVWMFRYLDTSTKQQNGQNHGPVWKIQLFLLSELCTVILQQDYYGKGNSRKFYSNTVGKSSKLGMCFVNGEKGLFLSMCVDDIKLAGKKRSIDPMWKVLNKEVDLREPTSFLWSCILGLHSKNVE